MRHIPLLRCFVLSLFAVPSLAQQSLFNVPSAEITEQGEIFFQEQINVEFSSVISNTTLDYGLGKGFEIGINLFNMTLVNYGGSDYNNPYLLFNAQKSFQVTEKYKVSVGTETGLTLPIFQSASVEVPNFSYIQNTMHFNRFDKYYLGAYYANHAFAGDGYPLGLMVGMEYPIVEHKFHFMGDLMLGDNDISVAVLGFVWYVTPKWQLSLGVQLPSPMSSNNTYGAVVELTKW